MEQAAPEEVVAVTPPPAPEKPSVKIEISEFPMKDENEEEIFESVPDIAPAMRADQPIEPVLMFDEAIAPGQEESIINKPLEEDISPLNPTKEQEATVEMPSVTTEKPIEPEVQPAAVAKQPVAVVSVSVPVTSQKTTEITTKAPAVSVEKPVEPVVAPAPVAVVSAAPAEVKIAPVKSENKAPKPQFQKEQKQRVKEENKPQPQKQNEVKNVQPQEVKKD